MDKQGDNISGLKFGFDFDGVLATEVDTWWSNLLWRYFPRQWCPIVHSLSKHTGLMPAPGSVIITGRLGSEKELTLKQMKKWGIKDCELKINDKKVELVNIRKESIKFKRYWIRQLNLDGFYENDKKIIKKLRRSFKNKDIIYVRYIK